MRKVLCVVIAFLATWLASSSAFAWGAVAHRYVTRRAIELLPPEIRPFFEHFRDELVLRSNDPDLWRVVDFPEEPPNHQIDLGVDDYGAYPFSALPREYGAALEKFGMPTLRRHGLLPWRTMEMFGNLRRVMAGLGSNQLYAESNTVLFAAALAHYIQDAHQPQHVHNNYDGQLTAQNGVHSRFESELFERFESRLAINPGPVKPVPSARDFIFDIILDAYQQMPQILQADREAVAGKDAYDQEYFERFLGRIKPLLERQLARAITATASAIAAAWEQAGRPELKTKVPRPVRKAGKPF